jgi:hypothetical protein
MKPSKLTTLLLLTFTIGLFTRGARAQEFSGPGLVTSCKSGGLVPGYKSPHFGMRSYARFACGSSVYIWKAAAKTTLVQQGSTVAYVASKYVYGTGASEQVSPAAARTFLQSIAEGLRLPDASAISARGQLVRSCLASRGCQVEAWSHLTWTRIKETEQLADSPDATLRLLAGGVYYSAFVVSPPLRYRDRPLPSLGSPVLVLDGGGLSLAIAGRTCYALSAEGKWAAAGASAVQSAAAIQ